jgi:ATP-dependent RNA helicase DDX18/HAS1
MGLGHVYVPRPALNVDCLYVLMGTGDTAAFQAQIQPLRDAAPPSLRFVLVTATLPTHTAEELKQVFKDITLCSGPGLHRTAPGNAEGCCSDRVR